MNSVKSIFNNFESMCDNVKKNVLLYVDLFEGRNKKVI